MYSLSSLNIFKTINYSYIFDIPYRTYTNDFFINNFYFIWTQFFILPTFMFFIICIYTVIFNKNSSYYNFLIITLLLSCLIWSVIEYYFINGYSYKYSNNTLSFNNLLSNPLNRYHPFVFFTTYLFLYKYYTTINYYSNYKLYQKVKYYNNITNNFLSNKVSYY